MPGILAFLFFVFCVHKMNICKDGPASTFIYMFDLWNYCHILWDFYWACLH